ICHVDASYLAHEDAKSHTGYCLSFGKFGSFYSKSSKQKLVATSSTHAEIRALYTLTLDIIYIVHLCKEVGRPIDLPAVVFEDNQPVIDLTKTLSSKITRSKHFLMLIEFIREQVMEGLIELRKIPTESNVADLLTKLIVGKTFTTKAMHLLGEMGMSLNMNESSDELNF
ncbi:MAG: Ty1/Copia family ribonuclease HI, partial [Planctomyces sp.]